MSAELTQTYAVLNGPSHEGLEAVCGRGREKNTPLRDKSVTFDLQLLGSMEKMNGYRTTITSYDPAPATPGVGRIYFVEGYYFGVRMTGFYYPDSRTGEVQITKQRASLDELARLGARS